MKNPRAVSAVTQKLSEQVYEHAKEGRCVLTLGGDHSIAIGSVSGTAKAIRERLGREMALIWVDAHADINTPETSDSGNVHGMPVAFLTRLAQEDTPDIFGWLKDEHMVSVKKIVYIGLRDVDRGEKKILRDNGIKAFSMHDIDRFVFRRTNHICTRTNFQSQTRYWQSHGNGTRSYRKRYPNPSLLRCRCSRSYIRSINWYTCPWRIDLERRRLYCRMRSRDWFFDRYGFG